MESHLQRILHSHTNGGEQVFSPILLRVDEVNRILVEDDEDTAAFKSVTNDTAEIVHLSVNDGTCSYDQFYLCLNEDRTNTLSDQALGLWNLKRLLLKVEEFTIERLEVGDDNGTMSVIVATSVTLLTPPASCALWHRAGRVDLVLSPADAGKKMNIMWRMDDPTQSFSDFRIIVQRDDIPQSVYHVHRNILAFGSSVRSEYFTRLFHKGGQLVEAKKHELCIHLNPLQAPAFPTFLDYLYTGKLLPRSDRVIDQDSTSLLLLADYFQVPSLTQLVRSRVSENMWGPHSLLQYLQCIIASQHIEEMKDLYTRAVFLLIDAILSDLPCVPDALTIIDAQFLLKVIQICHRLTRIHNPCIGFYVPQYKRTGTYRRHKYITSIIVHQYLVMHHNKISKEEFRALTNDDHMPRVCKHVAQYLLDADLEISSNDNNSRIPSKNEGRDLNEIIARSLEDRCVNSLEGGERIFPPSSDLANQKVCIKIIATDERFESGVFMFGRQDLERSGTSHHKPYCTNTQNKTWNIQDDGCYRYTKKGVIEDFPSHILHISQGDIRCHLTLRTSEDSVSLLSSCDSEIINNFCFIPVRGWKPCHDNIYFFLEYCLEDEINVDLPLAM